MTPSYCAELGLPQDMMYARLAFLLDLSLDEVIDRFEPSEASYLWFLRQRQAAREARAS